MSHQTICHDMTCCYGWTTVWMLNSIKLKSSAQVKILDSFTPWISSEFIDDVIFDSIVMSSVTYLVRVIVALLSLISIFTCFIFIRSRLLSVHGYAVSGLRPNETCQIPHEFGTWVHPKFQNSSRCIQKDERGQGKNGIGLWKKRDDNKLDVLGATRESVDQFVCMENIPSENRSDETGFA